MSHSTLAAVIVWNALAATILAVLAAVVGRFRFFRRRPAVMHLLWFGVLVRLVILPIVPLPVLPDLVSGVRPGVVEHKAPVSIARVADRLTVDTPAATTEGASTAIAQLRHVDWPTMLIVASLAGSGLLLARFVQTSRRFARLLESAQPAPESLSAMAADLAARLHVARAPSLRVVDARITPVLWMGRRAASIVIPRELVAQLDPVQLACIVSHELAHLVRRDHLFNRLAFAAVLLFWWHPIAWWAWRQMQARQEECCDALAIGFVARPRRVYAQTLLKALDFLQTRSELAVMTSPSFGGRAPITRRFDMIANSSVHPRCSLAAVALFVVAGASFVCLPVQADGPSDDAKASKPVVLKSIEKFENLQLMHESSRNLKELGLALHEWADDHKQPTDRTAHFPPAAIHGKDGKGKYPHSWRVELLPYLGARDLYNEYHFDEPWDSKANTIVLYKMAAVYRHPADEPDSIYSSYFALVGRLVDEKAEGAAIETFFSCKTGLEIGHITDGTANTIAIVEARRKIPWTKPEDIPYDAAKKLPELGGFFKEGFGVAMGDSSSHFIDEPIKDSALRAYISPAAGDKADYRFRRRGVAMRQGHISAK